MMPEEWPIADTQTERRALARASARTRLSTVRVDFFLDPAKRLTEQERALMTAMLHCLVGDIASELRVSLDRLNANEQRVRFTGLLSNDCVGRYYRDADGFLFPSLAEGFGIPVLESFHYGTPLLCSRTAAIPEVAGDAAIYFDPFDARNIADAIVRLYNEPRIALENVRRGRERLKLFSWHKAAQETLTIYRNALHERR